jgi:hypothetical protein
MGPQPCEAHHDKDGKLTPDCCCPQLVTPLSVSGPVLPSPRRSDSGGGVDVQGLSCTPLWDVCQVPRRCDATASDDFVLFAVSGAQTLAMMTFWRAC